VVLLFVCLANIFAAGKQKAAGATGAAPCRHGCDCCEHTQYSALGQQTAYGIVFSSKDV